MRNQLLHLKIHFGACSGLEINAEKTEVMIFGPNQHHLGEILTREGYKIVNSITHLGIEIDKNLSNLSENWNHKIKKMANLKNMLLSFSIPIASKINVAKCFLYSQLCYIGTLITPTDQQIAIIEKILLNFLYPRSATFSAARTFTTVIKGGLGLPEIRSFLLAIRIKFSLRAGTSGQPWANEVKLNFPDYNICLYTGNTNFDTTSTFTREHVDNIVRFQKAYYSYKDHYLSSPIFRSIFSASTYQPFDYFNPPRDIAESSILSAEIRDMVNFPNGRISTYGEFLSRFRVNFNIYFHSRNIVAPAIRNSQLPNRQPKNKKLNNFILKNPQARTIRNFMSHDQTNFNFKNAPSTINHLRQAQLDMNDDDDLDRYLTYINTWNTSFLPQDLKNFCLLFCSNKLNYNYRRAQWSNTNPNCSLCRLNGAFQPPPETISHIYLECPYTTRVTNGFLQSCSVDNASISTLIFAGAEKSELQNLINIEILTVLFFIHKSKLSLITPSVAGLKQHLSIYRNEMSKKSKKYHELLAKAKLKLGPSYNQSFL